MLWPGYFRWNRLHARAVLCKWNRWRGWQCLCWHIKFNGDDIIEAAKSPLVLLSRFRACCSGNWLPFANGSSSSLCSHEQVEKSPNISVSEMMQLRRVFELKWQRKVSGFRDSPRSHQFVMCVLCLGARALHNKCKGNNAQFCVHK